MFLVNQAWPFCYQRVFYLVIFGDHYHRNACEPRLPSLSSTQLFSEGGLVLGRVKFPNFFTAIPKNFLYGPASTLNTKFLKLSIRNPLGHSLEVLGWPQLQYSLSKITSSNLILLFDYNFLVLLVDEEFMVCPTTFIMNILKFRGTSGY